MKVFSRNNARLLIFVMLVFSLITIPMSVSAKASIPNNKILLASDDLSLIKRTQIDSDDQITNSALINIQVSQDNLTIMSNGYSAYIDVIATFSDGAEIDVTSDAEMKTSDIDVVYAAGGRIYARGKGTAFVTVSYGEFDKIVIVKVIKYVDLIKEVITAQKNISYLNPLASSGKISTLGLTSSERSTINSICIGMIGVVWYPTQDLAGFRNYWTYKEGTCYIGTPYTYFSQKNGPEFRTALNYSDFYIPYYNQNNWIMPRYANDCSGFTSKAWQISRQYTSTFIAGIQNGTYPKVGTYNAYNPSKSDLLNSYDYLQTGDAVVKSGHVMVVAVNNTSQDRFQMFEQRGPNADIAYFTDQELADQYYMPFAKH